MRKEPHPFSGAIYEEVEGNKVRITDEKRGKTGLFTWNGTWLEGNMTYADPHMLYLVGAPDLPPGKDIFWTVLPPHESSPKPSFTGNMGRGTVERPKVVAPMSAIPVWKRMKACALRPTFLKNFSWKMIASQNSFLTFIKSRRPCQADR